MIISLGKVEGARAEESLPRASLVIPLNVGGGGQTDTKVPGKKRKPKKVIIFIAVLSDCVAFPMRT